MKGIVKFEKFYGKYSKYILICIIGICVLAGYFGGSLYLAPRTTILLGQIDQKFPELLNLITMDSIIKDLALTASVPVFFILSGLLAVVYVFHNQIPKINQYTPLLSIFIKKALLILYCLGGISTGFAISSAIHINFSFSSLWWFFPGPALVGYALYMSKIMNVSVNEDITRKKAGWGCVILFGLGLTVYLYLKYLDYKTIYDLLVMLKQEAGR